MTTLPAHIQSILAQWQRKDDGIAQRFRTSFHDANDPDAKPIELELVLYPASRECRPLFPVRTLEPQAALHACKTMAGLLEVLMGAWTEESAPRFMAVSIPSGILAEGSSVHAARKALGAALLKADEVLGRHVVQERVEIFAQSSGPTPGWVPWMVHDKLVPLDTPWPPKFCQCGHSESEHGCEQFAVDATRCNEEGCECQVFVDVSVYGEAEPDVKVEEEKPATPAHVSLRIGDVWSNGAENCYVWQYNATSNGPEAIHMRRENGSLHSVLSEQELTSTWTRVRG